jgi:isopentenyl-diphosphate Delta-isomerase
METLRLLHTVPADDVVLLDDDGAPIGRAARSTVHTTTTPLHLAFSCYLVRPDGAVLLTRRALTKRTWPGVWTNAVCGHPRPGESVADAVERHACHELGVTVHGLRLVLPDFRYRAVDASGTVENEVCPVFVASIVEDPDPDPYEVMDLRWCRPDEVTGLVAAAPWAVSPWMVEQVRAGGDRLLAPPTVLPVATGMAS